LENSIWLIIVGILWGCTNPLMKYGSKGITEIKQKQNALLQFLAEFYFLFTNWKYVIPFLINMSGSIVFYKSLSNTDISLVVPITNSLTFLFTTLMGWLLGEEILNKWSFLGIVFVLMGVTICVSSKS